MLVTVVNSQVKYNKSDKSCQVISMMTFVGWDIIYTQLGGYLKFPTLKSKAGYQSVHPTGGILPTKMSSFYTQAFFYMMSLVHARPPADNVNCWATTSTK